MGLGRYNPFTREGRGNIGGVPMGVPLGSKDEAWRSFTGQREHERETGRIDRFAATQPDWAQMRAGILRGVEEGKKESRISGAKLGRQTTWDIARRGLLRSGLRNIAMRDVARRRIQAQLGEETKGAARLGELDLERRGWEQRIDEMRRGARETQRGTQSQNIGTAAQVATFAAMLFSDRRMKKDVATIKSALQKVSDLRGVNFRWKDGEDQSPKIGLIAQEVERVVPEVVHTLDDEAQTKKVDYQSLVGLLVEAVKELKADVEKQKAEINVLKTAAATY